jgi:hypothetical protein
MKMELALPDVDSLGGESLARIRKNLGTDFVVVGAYAAMGFRGTNATSRTSCAETCWASRRETTDVEKEIPSGEFLKSLSGEYPNPGQSVGKVC